MSASKSIFLLGVGLTLMLLSGTAAFAFPASPAKDISVRSALKKKSNDTDNKAEEQRAKKEKEREIKRIEADRKRHMTKKRSFLDKLKNKKEKTNNNDKNNTTDELDKEPSGELIIDKGKTTVKDKSDFEEDSPYAPDKGSSLKPDMEKSSERKKIEPTPAVKEEPKHEAAPENINPDLPAEPKPITSKTFKIAYTIQHTEKVKITRTTLWITKDNGKTWDIYGHDEREIGYFKVTVDKDGVYGFQTQSVDELGNMEPAPKEDSLPPITVNVDTTPPFVKLQEDNNNEKKPIGKQTQITLKWEIKDANLDKLGSLLQIRKNGGPWTTLAEKFIINNGLGAHVWTVPDNNLVGSYQFRLSVEDKAGFSSFSESCIYEIDAVPPKCELRCESIKDNIITLSYDIQDDSGLDNNSLALYYTADSGTTWVKFDRAIGPKNIEFASKEGGYQFYLIAADIHGNKIAVPSKDTVPMCSAFIDLAKPEVKLHFDPPAKLGPQRYMIKWEAKDSNFGATPITLLLISENSPAEIIAENLPNNGEYSWDLGQSKYLGKELENCRITISATDMATKTTTATSKPFSIICKIPVSRIEIDKKVKPRVIVSPEPEDEAGKQPEVEPERNEIAPKKTEPRVVKPEDENNKLREPETEPPSDDEETPETPDKPEDAEITPYTLSQIQLSLSLAKKDYENNDLKNAIVKLKTIIEHYDSSKDEKCECTPEIAETYYLLGMALMHNKAPVEEYEKALESSLDIAPRDKMMFANIGREKDFSLDVYNKWTQRYKEAIRIVGWYYFQMGEYDRALGVYNSALNFEPVTAKELLMIGVTEHNLGRYKESEKTMLKAHKKSKEEARFIDKNEKDALKNNRELQAKCLWYLARNAHYQSKYKEAYKLWKETAETFGQDSEWYEKALEQAKKALDDMKLDNQ